MLMPQHLQGAQGGAQGGQQVMQPPGQAQLATPPVVPPAQPPQLPTNTIINPPPGQVVPPQQGQQGYPDSTAVADAQRQAQQQAIVQQHMAQQQQQAQQMAAQGINQVVNPQQTVQTPLQVVPPQGAPQGQVPPQVPQMPQQQAPQMLQPGQQQQMPGQQPPAEAGQGQAQALYDHYSKEGVDDSLLQAMMERAQGMGVTEAQLPEFMNNAFSNHANDFVDGENYREYMEQYDNLIEHLAETYGEEQVMPMLGEAVEKIRAQGGDELVQKFNSDPEMLNPNIIMPYVTGEESFSNPYAAFAKQNNRGTVLPPANQQGQATNFGYSGTVGVNEALQQFANPQSKEQLAYNNSSEGQMQRLQLEVARRKGLAYI